MGELRAAADEYEREMLCGRDTYRGPGAYLGVTVDDERGGGPERPGPPYNLFQSLRP